MSSLSYISIDVEGPDNGMTFYYEYGWEVEVLQELPTKHLAIVRDEHGWEYILVNREWYIFSLGGWFVSRGGPTNFTVIFEGLDDE